MKKIIAFILCLMILCVPIVATAEGGDVTEGEASGDISTPEVDVPTEGEILPPVESPEETPEETPKTDPEEETEPPVEIPEEIPEETPEEIPEQKPEETPKEEPTEKPEETPPVEEPPVEEAPPAEEPPVETPPVETPKDETPLPFEEEVEMVSEQIKEWIIANAEEISVILTLIGGCLAVFMRLKTVIKSARTMNNNTITIAKASSDAIAQALASMENTSGAVTGYEAKIVALLEAFKNTAEDKARLEAELVEIKNYLKTATEANIAFSNELADLIALANIPNFKKEELGSGHVAQVKAILAAMEKAVIEADNAAKMLLPTTTEEVKENVGEEA
jgi:methyltransferase-like protein